MYIMANDIKIVFDNIKILKINKFMACNFVMACHEKLEYVTPWSKIDKMKNKLWWYGILFHIELT